MLCRSATLRGICLSFGVWVLHNFADVFLFFFWPPSSRETQCSNLFLCRFWCPFLRRLFGVQNLTQILGRRFLRRFCFDVVALKKIGVLESHKNAQKICGIPMALPGWVPCSISDFSQELSGDPNPQYFLKSTAVQMGGVLPYTWEAYCSTNGRCTVGFPFLQGLEATKVQRYKWGGGYCRTNWRCVYCRTFFETSKGWGV